VASPSTMREVLAMPAGANPDSSFCLRKEYVRDDRQVRLAGKLRDKNSESKIKICSLRQTGLQPDQRNMVGW
jgi:hypothetical protein